MDPKSKQDKIKGTNLKNLLNLQLSFEKILHATQLLKLLDKMGTYEMDPASIVENTEWTHLRPQTDKQTDGQSETRIPPFNFVESGVIIICVFLCIYDQSIVTHILHWQWGNLIILHDEMMLKTIGKYIRKPNKNYDIATTKQKTTKQNTTKLFVYLMVNMRDLLPDAGISGRDK